MYRLLAAGVALAAVLPAGCIDKAGLFDTMAMGVWPLFASAGTCVDL